MGTKGSSSTAGIRVAIRIFARFVLDGDKNLKDPRPRRNLGSMEATANSLRSARGTFFL